LASQPEALFLASYIADGAILVREARALGFAIPLLGASTVNSPEFLNSTGSAANGLVIADLTDSSSAAFKTRWENTFKTPYPGIQSGAPLFYDTALLLGEYLRNHEVHSAADYLSTVNYPGVSGALKFTSQGNLDRDHMILRVQGGRFETVGR
jgi:branched-chain amino acid transport system substrate-binding protein